MEPSCYHKREYTTLICLAEKIVYPDAQSKSQVQHNYCFILPTSTTRVEGKQNSPEHIKHWQFDCSVGKHLPPMRPISPESREKNSKAVEIQRVTSGRVATSYLTVIWSFPTRAVSTASAGGNPRLACSASPLISATPAKSHPEPKKTQHPNHKTKTKNIEICIQVGQTQRGEGNLTEVGELRGAALELELVAGEGLEPVLERVLQRPRYDGLHPAPPPRRSPWSGAAAARVGGVEPVDRRPDSGEMEKAERRGEGRWRGVELRGYETRWWALLGLRLRLPFGLSFFSTLFFLLLF